MDVSSGAYAAILLGFLLGLKHATDADHVIAISTVVKEYKNAFKGLWVGISWGLGHTAPLIILGFIILISKDSVMDFYEDIAHYFELGVAVMLIFLGLQVYWNLRKSKLHIHDHNHDGTSHLHIHGTHESTNPSDIEENHSIFSFGKPTFRMKSFVIGMIHGLAGSAAVMLALLLSIDSTLVGLTYLVLFGVGTVLSMSIITIALSVPFALSTNHEKLNTGISIIAGSGSVLFGLFLMYSILTEQSII
jgi:ABC-type nickel/cobalt efflux system permease component RcnA